MNDDVKPVARGPVRSKEPQRNSAVVDRLARIGLSKEPDPPSQPANPGETRIKLAAGYFKLLTWYVGLLAGVMSVALLTPAGRNAITPRGHPFLATGMAIMLTVGFAHTARLIKNRSKMGGFLGMGLFATDLIWAVTSDSFKPMSVVISIVGLAVLGSVWQHLDDDDA